ncbi:MAG: IS1595 family transposase [Chloroflexota bacterium]
MKKTMPETMSLYEFLQKFPDEESASAFFEQRRWNGEPYCPHCGCIGNVSVIPDGKPMPYRCRDCRKHFSVRTGTVLAESKLPLHKWLLAIFMLHTARKGVSSVQMAKEIGVTQKTAWFLNHRIREAMKHRGGLFSGEVEVDEAYIGGKAENMHSYKRAQRIQGRGASGKQAVFGMRQREGQMVRAFPIDGTERMHLQSAIVENVKRGATIYSDSHRSYIGLPGYPHFSVSHSVGEYVRDQAHTNGMESFWALLKRGYVGIYHQMSVQHLHRYVNEFSHRQNTIHADMLSAMIATIDGMTGRRLSYKELIA